MSDKLDLAIVTPQGTVFEGLVDEVTASGTEGEFGVLPGHAPLVTTLHSGVFTHKSGGALDHYFVSWGYAEVNNDKVRVLADSAEHATEIDIDRAREAHDKAIVDMDKADEANFVASEAALERAAARIHIAEHFGTGLKK